MKGCGSIGKPKYGLYSRAEVSEELWQEPEISWQQQSTCFVIEFQRFNA
jgi:hypothetical protein